MINRFEATVESCGSYAWLRLRRGRLAARAWTGMKRGLRITVSLRPEDVILCAEHPGRVSARNVLPGRVRAIKSAPEGVFVTVHVGFPLVALVTRAACDELELRPGAPVYALVKAMAVVPEWTSERCARYRLAPAGIAPERIDLLRAVARTGSLSAAARDLGVTYRTAWLWIHSMNEVWGAVLVSGRPGGRGGGGAVLTPEGRGVLGDIERRERMINRVQFLP